MATRYAFGNVEERGRPQAYARNFVDEASTGVNVAKAWGGVGNAMQGLGTMLVQRADRQARYDAMMANRDYQRQMRQRMNDPEKGIKATRKLGDARGVTQDTDKFADDLSADIKGRLSPEAQKYFDEIEPESREPFVNDASRYEAGETQRYNNMGFESSMQEHMDTVRSDPYNQEMFDMSAKEGILAIRSHMQGAPEASIRQAERAYLSQLEAARIGAVAENDPVLADELAQESTLLTPEDKAKVRAGVAPEIRKKEAAQQAEAVSGAVEELWKEFGDDEESARKSIYDSDLPINTKDELWGRYQRKAREEEGFKKKRYSDWFNEQYRILEGAGSREAALKMIDESGVDGPDKQRLLGVVKQLYPDKGSTIKEDPLVYSEVYERIARGEITTVEELIAQYGDKLKPGTVKELAKKIIDGAIADEGALLSDAASIKTIMEENDITTPEERAAFQKSYSDEVLRQQEEKKRKLTPIEKEMIARALAANEVKKKERWFMDKGIEIPKYQIDAMEGLGFKWDTQRGMWVLLDEEGKVIKEVSPDEAAVFIQQENSQGGGTRNTAPRSNAPAQQGPASGDVTPQGPADGRTPAWESRYGATYDRFSGTGEEESGDITQQGPTSGDVTPNAPASDDVTPNAPASDDVKPQGPASGDVTPAPNIGPIYEDEDEPEGEDEADKEDEADEEEEPDSETQQDVIYLDNPPSVASAGRKRTGTAEAAERTASTPQATARISKPPTQATQGISKPPTQAMQRVQAEHGGVISELSKEHEVPEPLIYAVIQAESAGNPKAVSRVGARGLMQLMPETARKLGVSDSFDPAQNITGGTKYLSQLMKRYEGNTERAIAAYNAGPNRVDEWVAGTRPLPKETQNFVRTVTGYMKKYSDTRSWDIPSMPVQKQPTAPGDSAKPEVRAMTDKATQYVNDTLLAHSKKYLGAPYGRPYDCSGLVRAVLPKVMKEAGFSDRATKLISGPSAEIIENVSKRVGHKKNPPLSYYREGMLIGLDATGQSAGFMGIDHISMVVRKPDGTLAVYESNGSQGIVLADLEKYVGRYSKIYVADPMALDGKKG
jgi:hypothetical protein